MWKALMALPLVVKARLKTSVMTKLLLSAKMCTLHTASETMT